MLWFESLSSLFTRQMAPRVAHFTSPQNEIISGGRGGGRELVRLCEGSATGCVRTTNTAAWWHKWTRTRLSWRTEPAATTFNYGLFTDDVSRSDETVSWTGKDVAGSGCVPVRRPARGSRNWGLSEIDHSAETWTKTRRNDVTTNCLPYKRVLYTFCEFRWVKLTETLPWFLRSEFGQ
jgi:hypothetical protein